MMKSILKFLLKVVLQNTPSFRKSTANRGLNLASPYLKVSSSNSTVSVAAKKQNGSKELELLTNTGRWFLRHKND
jgi:hypothetical protein